LKNNRKKMQSIITEVIGTVAAIGGAIVFLPQMLKVVKTKQTRDLSFGMWIASVLTVTSWLIYGILIGNYQLMLANAIVLPMSLTILWYKIKYK